MTKIYTRTGDKGTTSTFHGRVSKSDQLAQALGAIDELNSWIGICRISPLCVPPLNLRGGYPKGEGDILKRIQTNLLVVGSSLAGSGLKLPSGETKYLEKVIDKLTKQLPKLSNFVYPRGNLQIARSVCRRAERQIAKLTMNNEQLTIDKNILKYINRLSDALFTLARWDNFVSGLKEEVWKV